MEESATPSPPPFSTLAAMQAATAARSSPLATPEQEAPQNGRASPVKGSQLRTPSGRANSPVKDEPLPGRAALLVGRHTADYSVSLIWEVEATLGDLPDSANALSMNETLPIQGTWSIRVTSKNDSIRINVGNGLRDNRFLGGVDATLELRWQPDEDADEKTFLLAKHCWPAVDDAACSELGPGFLHKIPRNQIEAAGKLASEDFDYDAEQAYQIVFRLLRRPKAQKDPNAADETSVLARRLAELNVSPTPNDIRLFFPRPKLELWANSKLLSSSSPVLRRTIDSCATTPPSSRAGKRPRTEVASAVLNVREPPVDDDGYDDSDVEADEYAIETGAAVVREGTEPSDLPYRQLTLNDASYTTLRSVLLYLETGYIRFAPLRSSHADEARRDVLAEHLEEDAGLPLRPSPKSVYRLAVRLGLVELKQLALTELESCLAVENAAAELFDSTTARFPEVRKHVIDFIVNRWAQVKLTPGWVERKAALARGEHPGMDHVWAELFEAL